MDRQEFTEALNTALQEKVLAGLRRYVDQRIEYCRQLIRLLTALNEKSDEHILEKGLPGILSDISKDLADTKRNNPAQCYMDALYEAADDFPAEVIWQQDEGRFVPGEADSWTLLLKKRGKSLARSLTQKSRWTQKIPLRRVVKYHLAEASFIADSIHQIEEIQLQFITEIEQFLILQSQARQQEGSTFDCSPLINSLQQKVNLFKEDLYQQLADGIDNLTSEIQRQVERTDTVERKVSFYDPEKVEIQLKNMRHALFGFEEQWKEAQLLLLQRTENILGFLNLWEDMRRQKEVFLSDFNAQLQTCLHGPLEQLHEMIGGSAERANEAGRKDSYQQIEEIKSRLLTYINNNLKQPLEKLQDEHILSEKINNFTESLLDRINQAPEKIAFIFNKSTDKKPPTVNKKEIEWRLLLARVFREQMINELKKSEQDLNEFITEVTGAAEEIDDILDINLESALQGFTDEGLKADEEENPRQVAAEALERVAEKLDELLPLVQEKIEEIEHVISEGSRGFFDTLITFLDTTDTKEIQLFIAKYRVKETTGDWQDVVDSGSHTVKKKAELWFRFARKTIDKYIRKAKEFLGIQEEQIEKSDKADIAGYLSETNQKLKELPYIYRRLFSLNEIADPRFYVPVPEASSTFKKAYEQWQESFTATFAVVGEKGSGKSTFLELMADELPALSRLTMEHTTYTEKDLVNFLCEGLEIGRQQTIDEMIEVLKNTEQKRMVMLESIQNCFVRNINGYEAIEKLCYLISETKGHIFWMVSCSRYGWQFLDNVQSLSEYFTHIVRTDKLDTAGLQKVIMNRHRSSGYTLHFEEKSDVKKNRKSEKLTNEQLQQKLKEDYFKKLTNFAAGNSSIAMIGWIWSIRKFDEQCFYIKPLEVTSLEIVDDLTAGTLFVLAAFVLHDTVSDQDLSLILNLSREESRSQLKRLRSRGLLHKTGDYYILNHLMYRQIIGVLKDRNIIHLV